MLSILIHIIEEPSLTQEKIKIMQMEDLQEYLWEAQEIVAEQMNLKLI
jgi:hypothetical protein